MPNYMYVIMGLQMLESLSSRFGRLMCHYRENDDSFPIGGLIEPGENLMGIVIRYCHHLVNYRFRPNDRLHLAKVLNGFVNHERVEITI